MPFRNGYCIMQVKIGIWNVDFSPEYSECKGVQWRAERPLAAGLASVQYLHTILTEGRLKQCG